MAVMRRKRPHLLHSWVWAEDSAEYAHACHVMLAGCGAPAMGRPTNPDVLAVFLRADRGQDLSKAWEAEGQPGTWGRATCSASITPAERRILHRARLRLAAAAARRQPHAAAARRHRRDQGG